MYEKRLQTEYELLQKLQGSEISNIVDIHYKEREGGASQWKPIGQCPSSRLYPNTFRVTYTFPRMLVGPNQEVRNWKHSFLFSVSENVLMRQGSSMGVEIEGGSFPEGQVPFNNHVSAGYVCTGSAWSIAQQGYGIWYFIICVGCLLNQEKFMIDAGHIHLNRDALEYWKRIRGMRPNNDIKWPFDLNLRGSSTRSVTPPPFKIGRRQEAPKPYIKFGKVL